MNFIGKNKSSEKHNLILGSFYNDISLSLNVFNENELERLYKTVSEATYSKFGFCFNELKIKLKEGTLDINEKIDIKTYYSLFFINKVKVEYHDKKGLLNIFIKGPNAEDIFQKIYNLDEISKY